MIAPAPEKEIRRLGTAEAARLRSPILALGADPRRAASTRLVGSDLWRLRVGNVRVVYAVRDDARLVIIVRVAARGAQPYRRLVDR